MVEHERRLTTRFMAGLNEIPDVKIIGISNPERADRKIATVSFVSHSHYPDQLIAHLAKENILAWSGGFYALDAMKFLGLPGVVRFGFAHYNSIDDVDYALDVLRSLH